MVKNVTLICLCPFKENDEKTKRKRRVCVPGSIKGGQNRKSVGEGLLFIRFTWGCKERRTAGTCLAIHESGSDAWKADQRELRRVPIFFSFFRFF